ncbi:uncharacterized protein LOC143069466 [Mytilus galloprovincialis]|uniref:uncharacterized protein LOC143069466 n=1 Tax=Mytilus galloprovincialis TaxID=29158 RepID=UPI003F7C61E9
MDVPERSESEAANQDKTHDSPDSIIECLISYLSPGIASVSTALQNKERKRVKFPITLPFHRVIKELTDQCGLREEAEKRGLGSVIDVKIARLQKSKDGPKAYSISTQNSWELESHSFKDSGDCLQVTVLKKEVVFSKNSPVIQLNLVSTSGVQQKKSPVTVKKCGRRKAEKTVEDENLFKKMKLGETVQRNPRQEKDFIIMKESASKLSGSTPIDLGTIMCGRCGGRYTISNAYNRTPEARVLYFKSTHYDKTCLSVQAKADSKDKDKTSTETMKNFMTNWTKKPEKPVIEENQDDSDVDKLDDDENLL